MTAAQIELAAGADAVAIMRRHRITVGQAAAWVERFDGRTAKELCAALDDAFFDRVIDVFEGVEVTNEYVKAT